MDSKQKIIRSLLFGIFIGFKLVGDLGAEFKPSIFFVFGVILDPKPFTCGMELGVNLNRGPAYRENSRVKVKVFYP